MSPAEEPDQPGRPRRSRTNAIVTVVLVLILWGMLWGGMAGQAGQLLACGLAAIALAATPVVLSRRAQLRSLSDQRRRWGSPGPLEPGAHTSPGDEIRMYRDRSRRPR